MASLKSSNTFYTGSTTSGQDPQHGLRRRHNFGDRVYKLAPQETPFFAYLNAVGKFPTDDPVFRVLEDRAPIKWADRSFNIQEQTATPNTADSLKVESDDNGNWKWTKNSGSASDSIPVAAANASELIVGMLIQVVDRTSEQPYQLTGRISAVNSADIEVKTVKNSKGSDVDIAMGTDTVLSAQVIGTAFGEGTNAPTSFGYDIEDTFGYTQIFKTTAHMSNTAMATVMRGYASEWDRIWSLKLREHKIDIERAMLFNNKGSVNGVQYSDGIVGHILSSGATWVATDSTDLSYTSAKPYVRSVDIAPGGTAGNTEATYDRFLKDFEIIFAPERGGADQKFVMASLPVVTYMNQLKNGFMSSSPDSGTMKYNLSFSDAEGGLGHKVMKIDTVHGSLAIVKNPLLKGGVGSSLMVGVDLDNVKYRPLVGNGINRDTYIDTNVQGVDEDARKDLILTEAGLEVCMPESHFLYQFVSNGTPIG
jgi:hypothetical protein